MVLVEAVGAGAVLAFPLSPVVVAIIGVGVGVGGGCGGGRRSGGVVIRGDGNVFLREGGIIFISLTG